MKNFLPKFLACFFTLTCMSFSNSLAKDSDQFPNISGQALVEFKVDRILSTSATGVAPNNAYVNIEPEFSLNMDNNWSVKTAWRIYPTNTITTRDPINPERTRTFLSPDRGFAPGDTTLIVEELKIQFDNDDMKFFAGKFDPSYGKAYNRSKKIGIFAADITRDYEIREKIGAGISALLENSKVTFNSFFADTTGLSGSINGRDSASRNDGLSSNTGTLSSYTLTMEGDKFFGTDNWFYNMGYRSLSVDNAGQNNRDRETGYVFGTEYLMKFGSNTSVTPFAEITKISNFTGATGRNATYATFVLIGKYSRWTASASNIYREISNYQSVAKIDDRQLQLSVGYKFVNNVSLDVSRANIKESGNSASLFGFLVSYLYTF